MEAVDPDELVQLTRTPAGWDFELSNSAHLMHIVTVGVEGASMLGSGRVLEALHFDTSDKLELVDSALCGCVGKKRVVVFAPDELDMSEDEPWKLDVNSEKLREIAILSDDEAWAALEALAQRDNVSGAVLDLEPGKFVFVPHGWWHMVRPLEPFTVITGPGKASSVQIALPDV